MKKMLSFILALSLCSLTFGLDIFNYIQLKPNLSTYTQTDYNVTSKFDKLFRTVAVKTVHNYNNLGKEAEVIELSAKDAIKNKTENKYDVSGNLIEQNYFSNKNELISKTVYTYKGTLKTEANEYDEKNVLKGKIIYTYANSKLSEETGYNKDGALIWKTVYKYDDSGRIYTISQYSSNGMLDKEETYTYSKTGKIESVTTLDTFTGLTTQDIFRYEKDGTLTQITTYDSLKQITKRIVLKYDANAYISKVSIYNVAQKFGTTVNELVYVQEFLY